MSIRAWQSNARAARTITGLLAIAFLTRGTAPATDVIGTVQFQGQVTFAAPIPGIAATDLDVSPKLSTEATGNGEQCSILAVTSDNPDAGGSYPDAGTVSAQVKIERGGPQAPEGSCIVTVQARGTDGVSVSARGSQTLFVDEPTIAASGTVAVPTITVRESKAAAGVSLDCVKWVKKQLKKRAKCNFLLLKKGPSAADKCKDAGPEPAACDPGDFVETILAFAHDTNDQQTDPPSAEGVDAVALAEQIKCQKRFGKAAANFTAKRIKEVQKDCVDTALDSEDCRATQSRDAKKKLDQIDKCIGDQEVDVGTGRLVPDVAAPCNTCIDGSGVIDRKCLKGCFQLALDDLADGIVGDLPVCGDGILQPGEACDDGNLTSGDCCSATCSSSEGPIGDPTCTDALDNDCDGATDAADTDCQ